MALAFNVQPATATAGKAIPALQVEAHDSAGKLASAFTGSVTVGIALNAGGGTLSGTMTVTAAAGVATFSDLKIDKAGTGYRLIVSAGSLAPATSGKFDILGGPATQLVITGQPSSASAGRSLSPSIKVSAEDSLGNVDGTFIGNVTIALAQDPAGGTLTGTTTVAATAGVATFSALSLDKVGGGYTFVASASGLTPATSTALTIVAGSATHLVFSVQPSSAIAGDTIAPAIQVTAVDTIGNTATGYIGNISLVITGGTGTNGASLSGTRNIAAVAGVATFSTLSINLAGSGYTLTATTGGIAGAISAPFTINAGTPASLAFTVQPAATKAGAPITPAVQVAAKDSAGNIVPSFTGNVTVAIALGTGTLGANLSGTMTAAAVGGVATFSTLQVDSSGTGYRLTAAATGFATATSGSFTITAGTATQLVFSVQPTTTAAAKAISPSVRVTAADALGNKDPTFSGNVTIALGQNPPGGTLSGTTTVAAAAGVATFSTLSLDRVGSGYTLSASASGLTGVTSAPFAIIPGSATHLVFSVQPTGATAGGTISPPVQVTALDTVGNVATGYLGNVTVAITGGTGTPGAALSGTRTIAAVAGVASFSTLSINQAGTGYTLTTSASGTTGTISAPFNVAAAAADSLVFTVQPTATTAGQAISPVQVAAKDSLGNIVSSFNGSVTVALALGTGTPGATLAGSTTVTAVAGVATFSTLKINLSGTGYRLTAAATGISGTTSASFTITAGTATQLLFTVPPTTSAAGKTISPSVKVAATDALGNTDPTFSGNVTVAIGHNPSGGTLSGTLTGAAFGGLVTFSTLSIDKAGTGYTLTAAATGLTGATSAAFDITSGTATQLVVTVQPHNATASATIAPAVQVTALDAGGNPATGFVGNVTLAITAGTGTTGASLGGTRTIAAVAGVASFSTLSINLAGIGYTLTATASGLTAAISAPFNITAAAADSLVFTVQPTGTTAGTALTPAVQVAAKDSLGNIVSSFTGSVTVAIAPGTGIQGAHLTGTTTVAAVAGVATFSTLKVDSSGTGYRLTAAATGISSTTSASFAITSGAASKLVFTVQPTTSASGKTISPSVKVAAADALGNTNSTFSGNVTVAIGHNPSGGTLSGTVTVAAFGGVASFSTLSIDKVGTGYTLTAAATGLTGATSTAFDITSGTATQLVVSVQPTTTTAGATITPAVQVKALDAGGNPAAGFVGNVSLAITAGTGTAGATLSGTRTIAAVAGVATFSTLSINLAGTAYTLTATASGLTAAISAPFNITAAAADSLVFTVQPTGTTAGTALTPAVQVAAKDSLGNIVSGFTGSVTVAIAPGTGIQGAHLTGTTTVAAVAGVATFPTLKVDSSGTGYKLTAAATGIAGTTSASFAITPGAASKLVFTVQPTTSASGKTISPSVKVAATDALGNTDPTFSGNVTVAIGHNPSGGTLSGTVSVAPFGGVATFSTLSIDKVGTGYTLTAAATGLTGTTSAAFDITAGTATQLVVSVQPSTTTAGAMITPAVQVTALDAGGNLATGFVGNVTVAITAGTGTAGAALSGTRTVAAAAGVATFSTLSVDLAGSGYTLTATASGLTSAVSGSFNITPGTAASLVFTVQPTTTTAGATITPAVQVTARDAFGNTATGFTGNVTVAIGTNPSGGTLSGTTTLAATAGVASFSNLSINLAGTGYKLSAAATSLTGATSAAFNIQ